MFCLATEGIHYYIAAAVGDDEFDGKNTHIPGIENSYKAAATRVKP